MGFTACLKHHHHYLNHRKLSSGIYDVVDLVIWALVSPIRSCHYCHIDAVLMAGAGAAGADAFEVGILAV